MAVTETDYGVSFIESYRKSLRGLLETYVVPHLGERQHEALEVASVGCGIGLELQPLRELFPNARIQGIDVNQRAIEGAERMNRGVAGLRYLIADLSQPESLGNAAWDFLMVRNAQMSGSLLDLGVAEKWEEVIANTGEAIKPGGIACYTSDYEEDARKIIGTLAKVNGMRLVRQTPNTHSVRGMSFNDALVTVVTKT